MNFKRFLNHVCCLVFMSFPFFANGAQAGENKLIVEAETVPGIEVLADESASGGKLGRLPASMRPWGWLEFNLPGTISAGSYRLCLKMNNAQEKTASTYIYYGLDKKHLPENGLKIPEKAADSSGIVKLSFNASESFNKLVIKHGAEQNLPGPLIDWISIEEIPYEQPEKIRACLRSVNFPLISGIDKTFMLEKVRQADETARKNSDAWISNISEIELWLETVSALTELRQTDDYLGKLLSLRILPGVKEELYLDFVAEHEKIQKKLEALGKLLNSGKSVQAASLSKDCDAELENLIGKIEKQSSCQIMPETQKSPFSWLNSPLLQGFKTEGTSANLSAANFKKDILLVSEPTPYNCVWRNGPGLSFASESTNFSVDHSWTAAVWTDGKMTMKVSVFSPIVELGGLASFKIKEVESFQEIGRNGTLFIRGGNWNFLVYPENGSVTGKLDNSSLDIGLDSETRVSMLPVKDLAEAQQWMEIIPSLPIDAVQIQKNGVTSIFYIGKNKDKLLAVFPPLLQYAMKKRENSKLYPEIISRETVKTIGGEFSNPLDAGPFILRMPFAFINASSLSYRNPEFPAHPLAGRRGINMRAVSASPELVESFAKEGVNYFRLLLSKPAKKNDVSELKNVMRPVLAECRKYGIVVSLDPHFLGSNEYDMRIGKPKEEKDDPEEFVKFWTELASISMEYPDVVKSLDLMNEPKASNEKSVSEWFSIVQRTVDSIRASGCDTAILVEAPRWANPTGMPMLPLIKGKNIIYGFHLYYPHGFSHQQIKGGSAFVRYPAWVPVINWKDGSWNEPAEYWDKWTLRASCLPVYRWWIEHGYPPLDNGEFGVIGKAQSGVPGSIGRWTSDVIDINESLDASWVLYGAQGGFGWYDGAKPGVRKAWQKNSSR